MRFCSSESAIVDEESLRYVYSFTSNLSHQGLAAVQNDSKTDLFACYTRGDYAYTMGKISNLTSETAYPNLELNTPPSGLQDVSLSNQTGYTMSSKDSEHLINVQALYVDPSGALWVLDTGRPTITVDGNPVMAYATVGGPKLIRLSSNGSFERTYTFDGTVHYPDSYMNDVRFDLRKNITESGKGVAYIVDSSNEGRNAFIVLDLGTGKAHRRLENHPSVLNDYLNRPSYFGKPFYTITKGQSVWSNKEGELMYCPKQTKLLLVDVELRRRRLRFLRLTSLPLLSFLLPSDVLAFLLLRFLDKGFDGLALSPDREYAYYSPLTSQNLYRIPTSVLLDNSDPQKNEQAASNAVSNLFGKGSQTNGFDSDSNGIIYLAAPEVSAILAYDPSTLRTSTLVRDPRFFWIDSMVVADDGYIYFNSNQLPLQAQWNNGTEMRQKPGVMWRVKLPNGGKRITNTLM